MVSPTRRSCRRAARCSSPRPNRPICWTRIAPCCRPCRRSRAGSAATRHERWCRCCAASCCSAGPTSPMPPTSTCTRCTRATCKGVRRHGGALLCDAEVTAIEASAGDWRVQAGGREHRAPVLVNAAGAWCDRRRRAWPACAPSAWCPSAARPSSSRRRKAWMSRAGPAWSAPTRAGTSSPTPVCCSARRPMPTRWRRRT